MDILTKEEFDLFKKELFQILQKLETERHEEKVPRYLNSAEVKQMLRISDTKLYEMRKQKLIPSIKCGGIYLYPLDQLFENMIDP